MRRSLLVANSASHVLVVGDVMLDRYRFGSGSKDPRTQEAAVPVLRIDATEDRLGGAANVALNAVSLGCRCTIVGVVGNDAAGRAVARLLEDAGVQPDLIVADGWRTTVKEWLVGLRGQLIRMDFQQPVPEGYAAEVARRAERHIPMADALVVADYDTGTLANAGHIVKAAVRLGVPTVADPQSKPFASYRGATVLSANRAQLKAALSHWPDHRALPAAGVRLALESVVRAIALTGRSGDLSIFEASGGFLHLPAEDVACVDETGAGDTVAATLGVCMALGWPLRDAAYTASVAAGLVCTQVGTVAVTATQLNRAVCRHRGWTDLPRQDPGVADAALDSLLDEAPTGRQS